MESSEEVVRLDRKTDEKSAAALAQWAGLVPGMDVADVGCGSGKTTSQLFGLTSREGGRALGFDIAPQRVEFAKKHYLEEGCEFLQRDARDDLSDLGQFDFVWVRFVLEYYLEGAFEIARNVSSLVKPGGLLCLADLDHNCLSHHGISERLEKTLHEIMETLRVKANFDPFAGRRLYSHMSRIGFENIRVDVRGHHVIYGELKGQDQFNWRKKVEIAPVRAGYDFPHYPGGHEEFLAEFDAFFESPERFTYSPLICCVGRKPV